VPPRQREVLEWLIERGKAESREIEKESKLKGAGRGAGPADAARPRRA